MSILIVVDSFTVAGKLQTVIRQCIDDQLTVVCCRGGQCRVEGAVQTDHSLQMLICAVDQQKIQLTIVLIGGGDGRNQFIGGFTSEGESH